MTEGDAELLRRTAVGDRAAFEEIVARYETAVFRLARALAEHSAEDVLQETFLAVWRNASTFDGSSSARGWILAIARNAAYRQFRRHAGEPAQHETLSELGAAAGWARYDPKIFERLAHRELVQIGFRSLAPEEREILVLRDVEGFSGDEVASLLELTLPAMKSRLHRARLKFLAAAREK